MIIVVLIYEWLRVLWVLIIFRLGKRFYFRVGGGGWFSIFRVIYLRINLYGAFIICLVSCFRVIEELRGFGFFGWVLVWDTFDFEGVWGKGVVGIE